MATPISVFPHFQDRVWCGNLLQGCTRFSKPWVWDKGEHRKGFSCPEWLLQGGWNPPHTFVSSTFPSGRKMPGPAIKHVPNQPWVQLGPLTAVHLFPLSVRCCLANYSSLINYWWSFSLTDCKAREPWAILLLLQNVLTLVFTWRTYACCSQWLCSFLSCCLLQEHKCSGFLQTGESPFPPPHSTFHSDFGI